MKLCPSSSSYSFLHRITKHPEPRPSAPTYADKTNLTSHSDPSTYLTIADADASPSSSSNYACIVLVYVTTNQAHISKHQDRDGYER